jgi:hypothetical protein
MSPEDVRESKSLQEKQLTALEDIFNSLSGSNKNGMIGSGELNGLTNAMNDLSSSVSTLTKAIGLLMLSMRAGSIPGMPGKKGSTSKTPQKSDTSKKPTGKGQKAPSKPTKGAGRGAMILGGAALAGGIVAKIASERMEDEETASTVDTLGTAATAAGIGAAIYGEKKRRDAEAIKETETAKKETETAKKETQEVKKETETAKKETQEVKKETETAKKETEVEKKPSKIKGALGKVGKFGSLGGLFGGVALDIAAEKAEESGNAKTAAGLGIASEALTYGSLGATIGSVVPGVGTVIGGGLGTAFGVGKGLYQRGGAFFKGEPQTTMIAPKPVSAIGDKVAMTSAQNQAAKVTQPQQAPVIISSPTTNVQNKQTIITPQPVRNPDTTFTQYTNRNRVIV